MSRETSTDALRAYFERFGEIKDAVVKMDPATGQSRGFGFILFCNEASIEAVLAAGAHEIDGKSVSRLLLIFFFENYFDFRLIQKKQNDVMEKCSSVVSKPKLLMILSEVMTHSFSNTQSKDALRRVSF